MDPVPFSARLWYFVNLFDGLTESELRSKVTFPSGEVVREYARWNGRDAIKKASHDEMERAFFQRALDHGIRREWLARARNKIIAGPKSPPRLDPFTTAGGEKAAGKIVRGDEEEKAYRLLTAKNGARQPSTVRRGDLKQSLKEVGQLYPILAWQPFGQDRPIIADGATRLELLEQLDIEPVIEFLPKDMSALEVLQRRMAAELQGTTKDQTTEARDAYVAELHAAGFTQASIAKLLDMSQRQVRRALSTVDLAVTRRIVSRADEAEFAMLASAGWPTRAIAEETGWAESTVYKHLTHEPATPHRKPPVNQRRPGTTTRHSTITPEAERRAIQEAHFVSGKTVQEIARSTGKAENTVSRALDAAPLSPAIATAKAKAQAAETGREHSLTAEEVVALQGIINRFSKDPEAPCLRRFLARLR